PVATVGQPGFFFVQTFGLFLRQRRARFEGRFDDPGAVAFVVTEPQDPDRVFARVRLDLEVLGFAGFDAHRGGEALDRFVADPVELPVAGRVAFFRVLAGDGIRHRYRAGAGFGRRRGGDATAGLGHEDEGGEEEGRGREGRGQGAAELARGGHHL